MIKLSQVSKEIYRPKNITFFIGVVNCCWQFFFILNLV